MIKITKTLIFDRQYISGQPTILTAHLNEYRSPFDIDFKNDPQLRVSTRSLLMNSLHIIHKE